MNQAFVDLSVVKNIGTITFFHPQHNALPMSLLVQLEEALQEAGRDDLVKMILLKSGGNRSFCAGANFDELLGIENKQKGKTFFLGFGNVINAIRKVEKLVVGRIQGKAVGGGVGIASACDIAFATKFSDIRLSELSIGIGPFVIAPAVERKLGLAAFSELSLQPSKWIDAKKAQALGLYAEVFEDIDTMDQHLEAYLAAMSAFNPHALKALKEVLWSGTKDWDLLLEQRAELSGDLVLSEFTKNTLRAFKKK